MKMLIWPAERKITFKTKPVASVSGLHLQLLESTSRVQESWFYCTAEILVLMMWVLGGSSPFLWVFLLNPGQSVSDTASETLCSRSLKHQGAIDLQKTMYTTSNICSKFRKGSQKETFNSLKRQWLFFCSFLCWMWPSFHSSHFPFLASCFPVPS